MGYSIINAVSSDKVPAWGNGKQYIAVHYLGVDGQNHDLASDGCGAHYYIYWDGTIYQRCSHDAVVWQVGTAGYYTQKHPYARNQNCIGIEMCCHCDGDKTSASDPYWYFTQETQEACVWLVKKLMAELNIPAENVLRHYDIVNKECPAPYVHNNKYKTSWTWSEFKAKLGDTTVEDEVTTTTEEKSYYRVRKSWDDAKSQLGAYESLDNAKKNCPDGYTVYDNDGNAVYTPETTITIEPVNGTQASEFAGMSEKDAAAKILEMVHECDKSGTLNSVTAAQMILESGYCTTELCTKGNNAFGMKTSLSGNSWSGSTWDGVSTVTIDTNEEYTVGTITVIKASFRAYPCLEDSIMDHAAYLLGAMNGSEKRYAGLTEAKDYKEAITIIKNGGYATDSQYITKICSIIERYGLDKYDVAPQQTEEKTDEAETKSDNTEATPIYRIATDYKDGKYINQKYAFFSKENAMAQVEQMPGYKLYDQDGNVLYDANVMYRVQAGSYGLKDNATNMCNKIKSAGLNAVVARKNGKYIIQLGVYNIKSNAEAMAKKAKSMGFDAFVEEV